VTTLHRETGVDWGHLVASSLAWEEKLLREPW